MDLPIISRIPIFHDERGWFMSSFQEAHPAKNWKMQNISYSHKNTLRGLHYQSPNKLAQAKLLTVISGSITDVILDIAPDSESYGHWTKYELSAEDNSLPNQIYIPNHFAHGFLVTSDSAMVSYLTNELYHPEAERCIHPLSPMLNIPWGIENSVLSEKDAAAEFWCPEQSNRKI
jgi:dTDP-4-dehydrorhamnose 3,5-epimerase